MEDSDKKAPPGFTAGDSDDAGVAANVTAVPPPAAAVDPNPGDVIPEPPTLPPPPVPEKAKGRSKKAQASVVDVMPVSKKYKMPNTPDFGAAFSTVAKSAMSDALSGGDEDLIKLFNTGIRCIPFQDLFLMALLSIDGMPVDQNISVIGAHSSCKTFLAWELAKIWRLAGGLIYLVRAEQKWDPTSNRAIFTLIRNPDYDPHKTPGKDPDYEDLDGDNPFFLYVPEMFTIRTATENGNIYVLRSENMDVIQQSVLKDFDLFSKMYGFHEVGTGKDKIKYEVPRFPINILYDSLQGAATEDIMKAKLDDKDAGYGDMHQAKSFKVFLQTFTKTLQDHFPFSMTIVNHKHEGTETGLRREAGGAHKEAVYLLKIFCKKDVFAMNTKTGVDGTMPIVSMQPHKNSVGAEHGYFMDVKMHIWQDTKDTSGHPLRACFLWEEAFGNMMNPNILTKKLKRSSTIPKLLGYSMKDDKFVCPRLGFDEKHPASPANFAIAAQRDPEFVKEFKQIFNIRTMAKYEFGNTKEVS